MLYNGIALGIAFIVMLLISPKGIKILHSLKFGQEVRDDGPQAHLKKQGNPSFFEGCGRYASGLLIGHGLWDCGLY